MTATPDPANAVERSGHCLCGAVRVTARRAGRSVGACHCGMCRRWTGGPLLAIDGGTDVRFDGEDHIGVFESSDWAERGFCKRCGTHLFYRLKQERRYFLPVGLLDESDDWTFDHQVFIDEKPEFYSFANDTRNMTGAEVFAQFSGSEE